MQFLAYLAVFIIGALITAVAAWRICRRMMSDATQASSSASQAERSNLLVQLEAANARTAELSRLSSERESRIEQLQEERLRETTRRSAAEEQARRIPELEKQTAEVHEKLDAASARLVDLEKEKAELTTTVEKDQQAVAEKLQLVDEAKRQLSDMFSALSSEALKSNNQQFLDLAKQTLEGFQEGARLDLEHRQKPSRV